MAVLELAGAQAAADLLQQPGTVVLDTRGADDYWAGHILGARHIDPALLALTRTDRAAIDRFHALLAWSLSALGIEAGSTVLVTGAQNEVNASRVAWALAYAGIERIVLLDGGVKAWSGELTAQAPQVTPARFKLQPNTAYLATADDVLAASNNGRSVLDAREWDDYSGARSNAKRAGRVPGARFWDTRQELDAQGHFASVQQAAADAGASVGENPIVYCGGGGRAARTFVALQLAGQTGAAVYPASWNEWGNVDSYPVDGARL